MKAAHVDQIGQEMYNYSRFIYNFHVWKISHLMSRIVPITPKFQLPWDSVLHILDNLPCRPDELQDTPRMELNPFIANEKYRKVIYHVKDFRFSTKDKKEPIDIDYLSGMVSDEPTEREYIFLTSKLGQNLLAFKSKYKTTFKEVYEMSMIPRQKEVLTVINHNPLFRAKVRNKLSYFRKLQLILASVLNTACNVPIQKNQYIHIPLTNQVFQRDAFKKTKNRLDLTSIKFPNNYHYLIMMNILNYIDDLASTSMLDKIPEEYLSRITLILTVGNNAVFYQLSDLKPLNDRNRSYLRFLNQFNMLAMSDNPHMKKVIEAVPDENESEYSEPVDGNGDTEIKNDVVASTSKEVANELVKIKRSYTEDDLKLLDRVLGSANAVTKELTGIDVIIRPKTTESEESDVDPTSEEVSSEYEEDTSSDDTKDDATEHDADDLAEDTRDLVTLIAEHDTEYIKTKQVKQLTTGINTTKQNVDKALLKVATPLDIKNLEDVVEKDINGFETNSPCIKIKNETVDASKERSKRYVEDLDKTAEILIENTEGLTPAQKERYKKLSKSYENIVVGTKTVKEWMLEPADVKVTDASLDFLKNEIPDAAMLKSSVITMDNEYMEKSFPRDILCVANSFAKNGVFLTNVKVEPDTTEINKLAKYSFSYEDINGKTSTVHVTIPMVNKHGHMYINGVKKMLKKQMVNLPIVKVSPTRVSLASAMNKTIVERNVSKAYSFNKYVEDIIQKMNGIPGITVSVISSSTGINKPVAYEYSTLARSFKHIKIKTADKNVLMTFNYENAVDELASTVKQKEMIDTFAQNRKCVPFIKVGTKIGFININNEVLFMDSMGMILNSETTNIISFLHALSDDRIKIKQLSEWVTLKIRDKSIPIGFVLAYQYGLINILNYLGCAWTRIGRKDKRVIQENNPKKTRVPIPGLKPSTESYNPGDKYIIKNDDIVITFRDELVVINRYPITQSLIISGLNAFHTEFFAFNDMEDTSTYFSLLEMKGWSTNYLKAITGFFGYFIDHMTRDRLEMMHEPTNPRDLLIRCTQLLSTEDHRPPASMANHCLRSYERINTIIYNEMARALEEQQIAGNAASKFTLNPNAVLLRIVTDQAITSVEELNPVHDVKEQTGFTYTGIGGRTAQSFVMADRQYPDDGTGVISEATVDSGKVGIVAATSVNPTMVNTRGVFEHVDPKDLDPAQFLSVTAMLMPCVTNDD